MTITLFGRNTALALILSAWCGVSTAQPLVIAHRGASAVAPENTIAAFNAAAPWADFVELDVHKSSDGELVVIHDDTVDRTTNGTGSVASMTLAQLKALDAGSKADASFSSEKIPTLAEAVTAIKASGAKILLERKSANVSAADISAALTTLNAKGDTIVQSFDWTFIAALHALDPAVQVGVLTSDPVTPAAISQAQATGAMMMAVNHPNITAQVVTDVQAAGLELYAWTANGGNIQKVHDLGVDGIITDDPRLAHDVTGRNAFVPGSLAGDLVAYWKLDDAIANPTPATVLDSKGANHGTPVASPTWLTGSAAMFGTAAQFNGTSQRIDIPNSPDMDIGANGVTLSLWVKLGQLPAEQSINYAGVFDAALDCYVIYSDKPNAELRTKVTAGTGTQAARPGIPAADLDKTGWHHVVATFTGAWGSVSGQTRIYLNGKLKDAHIGDDASTGLIKKGMTAAVKAGQITAIGANGGSPAGSYFMGAVDDIGLWKKAVGQAEVLEIYNAGRNGQPLATLVGADVTDWTMY